MIEKMKKLSVLLYHQEKEDFLRRLRELGVVHVVENPQASSPDLEQLRSDLRVVERVTADLVRIRKERKLSGGTAGVVNVAGIVRRFDEVQRKKEAASARIAARLKDIAALEPWGDFDQKLLAKLAAAGVKAKFYEIDPKKLAGLPLDTVPHGVVGREGSAVRIVVFEHGEPVELGLEPVNLPGASLADTCALLDKERGELAKADALLGELNGSVEGLQKYVRERTALEHHECVRLSMEAAAGGGVLALTGWLPAARETDVRTFLESCTAWYSMEDPVPGDDVPILLVNNALFRLFEPITRIFALPAYTELDPTPFFAPFFAFFVGLCLGDVGYGAILIAASTTAFFAAPVKYRSVSALVIVLGLTTTLSGVLLNSCFGQTLFGGPGIPPGTSFLPGGAQIAILGPLETEAGSVYPGMKFAMIVGVFQVLLGLVLCVVNRIKRSGWLFGLQPVGFLCMVVGGLSWLAHANALDLGIASLTIGPVAVGQVLLLLPATLAKVSLFLGVVLHMFFNNADVPVWKRLFDPTKGVLELYFFVSGFLGNVLSYLRLFALGLAGGLLGNAFTYIAFMFIMRDGKPDYSSPWIVLTILGLLVGHSLNLFLSMIGAFVHPLRLTFVEFYGSLDFKGGGKVYAPFRAPRDTGIAT